MSEASLDDMLDLASGLAREAVAVSLGRLDDATAERKADNSLVTETDHAIQALILDAVAGAYPDHAVLAEETLVSPEHHADRGTARYCWVVDPLDGTRNYAAKFPCCSTSIAVLDGGVPVVGVVVEHHTGRLYAGACGRGVTLDGRAVRVAASSRGRDRLVGVESSKYPLTVRVLRAWVATPGIVLRNVGSTALHLGLVASGALDGAFCARCKIWDIAAGVLLVQEAGGVITDPFGGPRVPFARDADPEADVAYVAGRSEVHERLCASIAAVGGRIDTGVAEGVFEKPASESRP